MQMNLTSLWPGKTVGEGTHPALWHMLDVASVATVLQETRPLTQTENWNRAASFLILLHDLGKFSDSFRNMLLGRPYHGDRHWQHSFRLLLEHDDLMSGILGGNEDVRRILYRAVAGHHGGPPENKSRRDWLRQAREIGPEGTQAARGVILATAPLFSGASLTGMTEPEARRLSWSLCGLTVQSDWIGSNTDWFGVKDAALPVGVYWENALRAARSAVVSAGLNLARLRSGGAGRVLPGGVSCRPMQQAAQDVVLPDGPCLAMIEEATGAGKTEASLMLAARMLDAGKACGVFFALPTMATSNAMLSRLEKVVPAFFDGKPSLALSHGKARMNALFQEILGRDGSDPGEPVTCGRWLADDRRRVLLADVGVGTIDQALLAILPTRFNTLRLWALSGHVLIVDEAHSYDPYMKVQLERLLEFHALLGGSAILMTATLPLRMRDDFARAFQRGLGVPCPSGVRGQAYPALSLIGTSVVQTAPAPAPATCRDITVHRLADQAAALALLVEGASKGAACVWVRNSVDDAIAAAAELRVRGVPVELLHARFAVADRLARETELLARFGREGTSRAGRVLVATQVVESSLDLDFDLMVSDLAPIGALIQRAGRLWRHLDVRPTRQRPVAGPALHILSPDPDQVDDARWLHRVLDRGAWVYPQDVQWRTARAVFGAGMIRSPDGLRNLIEAVEGPEPAAVPDALESAEIETFGRSLSEAQQAFNTALDPGADYDQPQMHRVFDDDRFPTRLGLPQVVLRLAREDAGQILPWAGQGNDRWHLSEVQMSVARFSKLEGPSQDLPEIAALRAGWPDWKRAGTVIALVAQDGRICEGLHYDSEIGLILA